MSSGSPGNTRAKRGKQRKVAPREDTQLRRGAGGAPLRSRPHGGVQPLLV